TKVWLRVGLPVPISRMAGPSPTDRKRASLEKRFRLWSHAGSKKIRSTSRPLHSQRVRLPPSAVGSSKSAMTVPMGQPATGGRGGRRRGARAPRRSLLQRLADQARLFLQPFKAQENAAVLQQSLVREPTGASSCEEYAETRERDEELEHRVPFLDGREQL